MMPMRLHKHGRALRVLIVEDEAIIRLDLQAMIEAAGGLAVSVTDDALEALAAARTTLPDVVLMDVKLRGQLDGLAAAESITREMTTCSIIFVTGVSDPDTLRRIRQAGAHLIIKPTITEELIGAICAACRLGASGNAAVPAPDGEITASTLPP